MIEGKETSHAATKQGDTTIEPFRHSHAESKTVRSTKAVLFHTAFYETKAAERQFYQAVHTTSVEVGPRSTFFF